MAWSIDPGGDFPVLKVTSCSRTMQSGGRSTCNVTFANNLATAHSFAEDDEVEIAGPDGVFFAGIVDRPARSAQGATQDHTLTLTTKWKWLEEIPYTQPFASGSGSAAVRKSSVVLGLGDSGTRQTTAQIISGIISYANGQGAGIVVGSILSGATLTPPLMQMADSTCAEAIRAVLRWHPDAVLWFAPDGTFNIHVPAAMTEVTRGIGGANQTSSCSLWPRQDVGLRGVVIHYEITTTVDGVAYMDITNDTAGATTGRRVAHFTIALQGANIITQQQEIETLDIPDGLSELGPWMILKFPEIAQAAPGAGDLTVNVFEQDVFAAEKVGPGTALSTYPRELIKGSIQPWMTGVSAAPTRIRINLTFTGDAIAKPELAKLFPGADKTEDFFVELTGTDAHDRTYRTAGGTAGETIPTGLAAAYFHAFQTAVDEGSYTQLAEGPDVVIYPGKSITLTGSAAVTKAPVQSSTTDVFTGNTTVTFGPMNRALTPGNFLEMLRAGQRQQPIVNPAGSIRTDATAGSSRGGSDTIHGATGGRWKNTSRTQQPGTQGGITPWLCTKSAALTLRVYPSLIWDGYGNNLWCDYSAVTATPESFFDIPLTPSAGTLWLYLQCGVDDSDDYHGIIAGAELLVSPTEPDFYQLAGGIVNIPVCQVLVGPTTFTIEQVRTFVFTLRRFGPAGSLTWDVLPVG